MSCFDAAADPKAFYELLLERVHSCFDLHEEFERYIARMDAESEARIEARRAAKRAKRKAAEAEAVDAE